MSEALDKMLMIASDAIGPETEFRGKTGLVRSLLDLLSRRNGFYAFESALLVRPGFVNESVVHDVRAWNKRDLWKYTYAFDLPDILFFAESVFADQFGIMDERIVSFDSETGEISDFAKDLDDWAEAVMDKFDYWTGYSLARDWQKVNGPLPLGYRLITRQPFVLGGDYSAENLVSYEEVKGMRVRGFLATQIHDVPDGGKIEFELTD